MFGCIKNIVEVIIIIFAVIGFFAIGGDKFIKTFWQQYHSETTTTTSPNKNPQANNITNEMTLEKLKFYLEKQKKENKKTN